MIKDNGERKKGTKRGKQEEDRKERNIYIDRENAEIQRKENLKATFK